MSYSQPFAKISSSLSSGVSLFSSKSSDIVTEVRKRKRKIKQKNREIEAFNKKRNKKRQEERKIMPIKQQTTHRRIMARHENTTTKLSGGYKYFPILYLAFSLPPSNCCLPISGAIITCQFLIYESICVNCFLLLQ